MPDAMPGNEIGGTLFPGIELTTYPPLRSPVECNAGLLIEKFCEADQDLWRELRDLFMRVRIGEDRDDVTSFYPIRNSELRRR